MISRGVQINVVILSYNTTSRQIKWSDLGGNIVKRDRGIEGAREVNVQRSTVTELGSEDEGTPARI